MTETLPVHSPLGASSAERWMNCPGSVSLCKSVVGLAEPADPEYRKEGTAAHSAIAYCLSGSCPEPWEVIGDKFDGVEVTTEMADAIQVFIDKANALSVGAQATYVEEHLNDPDNKYAYGTIDYGAVHPGLLAILDFKYGIGVRVETHGNMQMLYYAYLVLLKHPDVRKVSMEIVQPRIFKAEPEEPWVVDAEYVMEWAQKTLLPAMQRTEKDATLVPGEHCRFCDAKAALACPALKALYKQTLDAEATVAQYPNATLLADWENISPVKMHIKAIEDEVMRRLMASQLTNNGKVKLVNKKANRVWKPEAPDVFRNKFGADVMNAPEFKSPAEMEKIGPEAKKMVHEYAYTPQSGYTVTSIDDKRPEAKPKSATESFSGALDAIADL